MNDIKVSIIVPVYNVEKYIEKCIDSIINQTYKNLEIILVDDGSTDKSGIICNRYAEIYPEVVVIYKENGGLSDARNAGIMRASGDYCIFVDSDDYYANDSLIANLVREVENLPDFVMFWFMRCSDDGLKQWNYYKKIDAEFFNTLSYEKLLLELVKKDMFLVSAWSKMIRTDILRNNDLLFEKGLISEDIDWFFKLITTAHNCRVSNEMGYIYRVRMGSITKNYGAKACNDLYYIINKWNSYCDTILKDDQSEIKRAIKGFLAYEYYILLGNARNCKVESTLDLNKMKSIVDYSCSKKTKWGRFVYKFFGERIAMWLFALKTRL